MQSVRLLLSFMEKALHITRLNGLKYFQKGKYQRIYWGPEFCQNIIPTIGETTGILRFTKQNNLELSIVTPFVTERGLRILKKMFNWIKGQKIKNPEIIVNDWGVLECLNMEFRGIFEISLGRLLVRQQRDPAMKTILEKQLPFWVKKKDGNIAIFVHRPPSRKYQTGIKASYVNSSLSQDLLSKFGIKRVELNNLIQGLSLEGIRFKKSLYTPYINISTTRFCPMETRYQKIYRINVCKKECQRYLDILRNRNIPKIIYKRGNTIFYKNPLNQSALKKYDIDRVVFQPELFF